MSRFVVSYLIPPPVSDQIAQNFLGFTGKPLPISHIHVTLIPTFFLKPSVTLDTIAPVIGLDRHTAPRITQVVPMAHQPTEPARSDIAYHFGTPSAFSTLSKHILYLPILPPEPLIQLHTVLANRTAPFIDFDVSLYNKQTLPLYMPHLSLDYDFQGDLHTAQTWTFLPPDTGFNLDQLVIFEETTPGHWEIV